MGLDIAGLGAVAELAKDALDRFIPDKTKAAELKAQLDTAVAANNQAQVMAIWDNAKAQVSVDQQEAASGSLFVAGWRPAVGWAGAVAVALAYWPKAVMLTGIWTYQSIAIIHGSADAAHIAVPAFPDLGLTDLLGLLGSILGLGAMRMHEKINGVSTGH